MQKKLFILIAIAMSGCSVDPGESALIAAQRAVEGGLKDPSSAKHGKSYLIREQQKTESVISQYVCGSVDGKNSFGAYNGGTRYIVTQTYTASTGSISNLSVKFEEAATKKAMPPPYTTGKIESIFENVYWNKKCVDEMHPPTYTGIL